MRVFIHPLIPTIGKTIENKKDIKEVKEQVYQVIYDQLIKT
jgi:hypothetical protein